MSGVLEGTQFTQSDAAMGAGVQEQELDPWVCPPGSMTGTGSETGTLLDLWQELNLEPDQQH